MSRAASARRNRRRRRAESRAARVRLEAERDRALADAAVGDAASAAASADAGSSAAAAAAAAAKVPRTFVFGSRCGASYRAVCADFRRAMNPFTAARLRSRKGNSVKDFLAVSSQYGVTHFVVFSETDLGSYVKFARVPRGPTLTYKVHAYTTCGDLARVQRSPQALNGPAFAHAPLVVLNNFPADESHEKLATTMLQGLFPALSVSSVQLSECRRVVLFSYDLETKRVDFRHFLINLAPTGVSRSLKRVVRATVPTERLARCEDIADFVLGNDALTSDSEREDTEETRVTLEQDFAAPGQGAAGRGAAARAGTRQAIRLVELGPRLQMQLLKVEEGLMDGAVLFHEFVSKTPEEITALERRRKQAASLKAARKKRQQANVDAKGGSSSASSAAAAAAAAAAGGAAGGSGGEEEFLDGELEEDSDGNRAVAFDDDDSSEESSDVDDDDDGSVDSDDDASWYRREVGEAPAPGELAPRPGPGADADAPRAKFNPLYGRRRGGKRGPSAAGNDPEHEQEQRQQQQQQQADDGEFDGAKKKRRRRA